MDVVNFCSRLIEFNSITPAKKDIFEFISAFLINMNFETQILPFTSPNGVTVYNLFAKRNMCNSLKTLGFLGHVDIVPAGDNWKSDPFIATVKDGKLIGRGVCDMKSGVAAFCCALEKCIDEIDGGIEIFLTGDEENGLYEGTQALLEWTKKHEQFPANCLIGEPSSINKTGDRIFLGHRGSLNVEIISHGKQGHVAFVDGFDNSLYKLCKYITKVKSYQWKQNSTKFPKTNLEPTLLYNQNYAVNVVPDKSSANINIRFSDDYTSDELEQILIQQNEDNLELIFHRSGEAYYCEDEILTNIMSDAIFETTGLRAELSGAGGTSDGRFMKNYCNVIEFGVPDATMHQKDEHINIDDLINLEKIYIAFLKKYFA